MFKTTSLSANFFVILAVCSVIFIANNAAADIYKWRDKTGVTQYSDNLPAQANSNSLHQNTINNLQSEHKKSFCDDTQTNQRQANKLEKTNLNANFFNIANTGIFNTSNSLRNTWNQQLASGNYAVAANNASKNYVRPAISSKPVLNQYLPFSATKLFNWGGKSITVFDQPIKTTQYTLPKSIPAPTSKPELTPQPIPPPVATGKTYYIAINGDNNNPGNEALPWRTLNHAVYALNAGETVLVKNGTYQESLYINKSGSPGKPITYKAYPGHVPKIEISQKQLEGILIQGVSYINVEGFEVVYTAPGAEAAKGEQTDNGIDISNAGQVLSHHINIKNNKVHGFPGGGIFTVLADYVTFEGNTVWGNALWAKWGNSGISMYQNVDFDIKLGFHMIVRGNTLYKNENKLPSFAIGSTTITDGNCIIIDDLRHTQKFLDNKKAYSAYSSSTLIENNVCYDNGARGIHVYSSDNVLVRHNTLYKNQRTISINDGELSAYDASNVRFVNNIVYAIPGKKANGVGNTTNVIFERNLYFGSNEIPNKSATDLVADPMFVSTSINPNAASFNLRAGSPAIDKALFGQSPAVDIVGTVRTSKADIGAYEAR